MQKSTVFKPSTFICGVAALLLAGTMFLSPTLGAQGSTPPAQQTPPPATGQDSSAASAPAKPAAKMTPEAKHAPAPTSKAKPSATAPAKKPTTTKTSQANDATKASSSGSAPAASTKQAATAQSGQGAGTSAGQAGTTKTGQSATSKTAKTGASKTATAKTAAPLTLTTPKDKQSYAIGINVGKGLGQNLKQSGVDIDPAILTRAIKDVLAGNKQSMTDQEAQETLKTLQADMRKSQEEKAKALADNNKKEGDEFLVTNKAKEGVTTLPDGLQYKVLQEGTGPKPTAADSVTVNYRGTLLNGTEFDSSYKRGQPATFQVSQIIKGWTEALQLMSAGSKWQLFIPSELAYGPRGAGRDIGPNACLVFEVELLSIQPKLAAPAPAVAPATAPATAPVPTPAPAANAPTPVPTPTPKPQTP